MNNHLDLRENKQSVTTHRRRWIVVAVAVAVVVGVYGVDFIHERRMDARRVQCICNLSSIAAKLHEYEQVHGKFPEDRESPSKQRLLSWRVELLSVLDRDLYERFNMEEPWNSEHNLRQLHAMPHYYSCPSDKEGKASGTTSYYIVVPQRTNESIPPHATFDLDPYTDGQCILLVESADLKIPWTKPGDLPGDPCDPGHIDRKLTSNACKHPGGTYIVMVNTIRRSLEDEE